MRLLESVVLLGVHRKAVEVQLNNPHIHRERKDDQESLYRTELCVDRADAERENPKDDYARVQQGYLRQRLAYPILFILRELRLDLHILSFEIENNQHYDHYYLAYNLADDPVRLPLGEAAKVTEHK